MVKLLLIVFYMPYAAEEWYGPFVNSFLDNPSFDPWFYWLDHGGTTIAFPYGVAMLAYFVPFSAITKYTFNAPELGYLFGLLFADFGVMVLLIKLSQGKYLKLLYIYWVSPLLIAATYVQGLNDIVPVMFLLLSVFFLKILKFGSAGTAFSTAVSVKLGMIVALPFILFYFINNRNLHHPLQYFSFCAFVTFVVLGSTQIFSIAAQEMILFSPGLLKVFEFQFSLGQGHLVFVFPLFYMLFVYFAWRTGRVNCELLISILGLVFLLVVVLSPAPTGWFLWALPFICLSISDNDKVGILIITFLSLLLSIFGVLNVNEFEKLPFIADQVEFFFFEKNIDLVLPTLKTAIVAVGLLFFFRLLRYSIFNNEFFKGSSKPFVIGISGDSGVGKDTLVNTLTGLFGSRAVTSISGDDYHHWDRQMQIWGAVTHLNPMANDLDLFNKDFRSLSEGRTITARRYNHSTGRFEKRVKKRSSNILIASGLHVLHSSTSAELCDLRVFLKMDLGLRKYLKLKRDTVERGHDKNAVLSSFDRRKLDSKKFIEPQEKNADIIINVEPLVPIENFDVDSVPRLKIIFEVKNMYHAESIVRALINLCAANVDFEDRPDLGSCKLIIDGMPSAEDVEHSVLHLVPEIFDYLDNTPRWQSGVFGIMQLLLISQISYILKLRSGI
ncbi:hypothetical protein OAV31_00035 [bacterium]|nr:hypothetical protein [bacterium]